MSGNRGDLAGSVFHALGEELASVSSLFQTALEYTLAFSTTSAIGKSWLGAQIQRGG